MGAPAPSGKVLEVTISPTVEATEVWVAIIHLRIAWMDLMGVTGEEMM